MSVTAAALPGARRLEQRRRRLGDRLGILDHPASYGRRFRDRRLYTSKPYGQPAYGRGDSAGWAGGPGGVERAYVVSWLALVTQVRSGEDDVEALRSDDTRRPPDEPILRLEAWAADG